MRVARAFLSILALTCASDGALAQGTKDPSNPIPTMVVPIRPRDEPAGSTAVPNRSYQQPYVPRFRRIYPAQRLPK
jgi:hypothetical protein